MIAGRTVSLFSAAASREASWYRNGVYTGLGGSNFKGPPNVVLEESVAVTRAGLGCSASKTMGALLAGDFGWGTE